MKKNPTTIASETERRCEINLRLWKEYLLYHKIYKKFLNLAGSWEVFCRKTRIRHNIYGLSFYQALRYYESPRVRSPYYILPQIWLDPHIRAFREIENYPLKRSIRSNNAHLKKMGELINANRIPLGILMPPNREKLELNIAKVKEEQPKLLKDPILRRWIKKKEIQLRKKNK